MTRLGLPQLPRLGAPRLGQVPRLQLTEEDEQSLIGRLGSQAAGGLAALGNALDLPSSVIRDVMVGQNPIDQLVTPFSSSNRTTGRELLRQYGLVGRGDTYANFAAGLAAEIALDPLTYLTFGGSALSKAGRVAKNAGLLDEATRAAGRGLNPIGPRQFRVSKSLDDLMDMEEVMKRNPGAKQRLEDAAKGMGTTLEAIRAEKLGGNIGLGLPFKEASVARNLPFAAESVARGLDVAGEAIRYSAPVRAGAAAFSRATKGVLGTEAQRFVPDIIQREKEAISSARATIATTASEIDKSKFFDIEHYARTNQVGVEEATKEIRNRASEVQKHLEGIEANVPEELIPHLDSMTASLKDLRDRELLAHLKSDDLQDVFLKEYFPRMRFFFEKGKARAPGSKLFPTTHPSQLARKEFLKDNPGGTDVLNKISLDEEISGFAHRFDRTGKLPQAEIDRLASVLESKYFGHLAADANFKQLARWAANLDPKHVETGIPAFEMNPLKPMLARMEHGERAIVAARGAMEFIADNAGITGDYSASQLLKELKLTEGAGDELLKKMSARMEGVDDIESLFVPSQIAEDVKKFVNGFTTPESVGPFVRAIDAFTNAFKAGVTALWPAFHVRNFGSGQFQNWIADAFDFKSLTEADSLVRGQEIKGLGESIWGEAPEGSSRTRLTDGEATEKLRQEVFAHQVVHAREGISGEAISNALAGNLRVPGSSPTSLLGVPFQTPAPVHTTLGERINPLNVASNVFTPSRVGHDVSQYVEGLNRVAPYINLRKKGWSPAAAADRVAQVQIDYQSRAATDSFTRRLFPFFTFTRGVIPFTLEQVLQRPGGRLGQTVRAVNRSRDPDDLTPDWVASSTAIPLGELPDGSRRFLSSLGLMFENPLEFLDGGMRGAGLETLERLNPLLKMPLEMSSGQSFFKRGPFGGRDLESLDPTIGRTISNVRQMLGGEPVERPEPFISKGFEFLASNTPFARLLSSARTLSDPRKGLAGTAANLLTGMRVTDVSPAAQDRVLRDRAQDALRKFGSRTFTKSYIPVETMLGLPPEQQREAMEYNAVIANISERVKERKLAIQ
jgi:hypothetical protein